jgi:hypothetical protein
LTVQTGRYFLVQVVRRFVALLDLQGGDRRDRSETK